MKRDLAHAIVLAIVLGSAVAIGAWLTAPQRGTVPPTFVPLKGEVPQTLVYPVQTPDLICGLEVCAGE